MKIAVDPVLSQLFCRRCVDVEGYFYIGAADGKPISLTREDYYELARLPAEQRSKRLAALTGIQGPSPVADGMISYRRSPSSPAALATCLALLAAGVALGLYWIPADPLYELTRPGTSLLAQVFAIAAAAATALGGIGLAWVLRNRAAGAALLGTQPPGDTIIEVVPVASAVERRKHSPYAVPTSTR